MASTTLVLLAAAIVVGVGLAYLYPDETRRWWTRVRTLGNVLWAVIGLIISFVLIGSGSPLLMAIGFLGVLSAVLYLVFEDPVENVRNGLGL